MFIRFMNVSFPVELVDDKNYDLITPEAIDDDC